MRPAAPHTASGQIPVSDPRNDPFWARANEAGITVVVHAGDSGYSSNGYAVDGFAAGFSGNGRWAPSVKAFHIERAAYDFLITLVFDKLFERFPNVRVASVENGAEFLGDLFNKLRSTDHKMPGYFTEDPVESFKRNVWINPFWEDDVNVVVDHMGADRVIFGSDWPHIEGMPRPLDYAVEVKQFDDADQQRIMRDNARELDGAPARLRFYSARRTSAMGRFAARRAGHQAIAFASSGVPTSTNAIAGQGHAASCAIPYASARRRHTSRPDNSPAGAPMTAPARVSIVACHATIRFVCRGVQPSVRSTARSRARRLTACMIR